MSTLPEVTEVTVIPDQSGIAPAAVTTAAIVGAFEDGETSAGVVKERYQDAEAIGTDHGTVMENAARAAFQSQARRLFAGTWGVDTQSDEVIGSSDSEATDEGTLAESPVLAVSSITVDGGAALDVIYTEADPSILEPAAGEAYVNTLTRKVKTGVESDGSSAGIVVTYTTADTKELRDALLMRRFQIITLAGLRFNAQNLGIWDHFTNWALDNGKTAVMAFENGVSPSDIEDLAAVGGTKKRNALRVVAKEATGDLNGGLAGMLSARPPNGTLKEQPAPAGITFSDTYTLSDFGSHRSPQEGTFHEMGVVAVYRDFRGVFRTSADVSAEATGFYKNISTWSTEAWLVNTLEDTIRRQRRESPVSMPYTIEGMAGVEASIRGALSDLVEENILESVLRVTLPDLNEVPAEDKEDRVLSNVQLVIRFAGQIEFVSFSINLSL